MSYGGRFLIDDPTWAIDFASNGRYCHSLYLELSPTMLQGRYLNSTKLLPAKDMQSIPHFERRLVWS